MEGRVWLLQGVVLGVVFLLVQLLGHQVLCLASFLVRLVGLLARVNSFQLLLELAKSLELLS